MKATGNAIALGLTLILGGTVMAGQHGIQPIPDVPYHSSPAPVYSPAPSYGPAVQYEEVELFGRVKYKDRDEMAPCAVTKVIQVNDPRGRGCCGPGCVNVEICVPGGRCERVKSNKRGDRIRYDYGDYKVDVRIKKGYVEVDYQD